jgi:hypothetical protein
MKYDISKALEDDGSLIKQFRALNRNGVNTYEFFYNYMEAIDIYIELLKVKYKFK